MSEILEALLAEIAALREEVKNSTSVATCLMCGWLTHSPGCGWKDR